MRRSLLRWYARAARDLPWRRESDPYRIWVAEIMLQQTQVATVVPFYERFLARFPELEDLASAAEDDVLAAWQGLGYYRRARQLKAAAELVVARHGGRFPDDLDAAMALPGVGAYTAGAVLSIAYDRPLPAVDGNADRVLARLLGEDRPLAMATVRSRLRAAAIALVPEQGAGDWTQALMELGALVCTPSRPVCPSCPVADFCVARALGRVDEIPAPKRRKSPPRVEVAVAIAVSRDDRLVYVRRPKRGVLAGFLEFPSADVPPGADPRATLAHAIAEHGATRIEVGEILARAEHVMFHRRARLTAYRVRARWVLDGRILALTRSAAAAAPVTTASRKLLALIPRGRKDQRGSR